MRRTIRRRGAMIAVTAALSAGGLMLGTAASASASALIPLTTANGAALFNGTTIASGTVGVPDLWPGDTILATCWSRGDNLGGGNVWYRTVDERYAHLNGLELTATGWTYGAYVDTNTAFHNGSIPQC